VTEEYTGIFDIPPAGGGLNESERLLARLCLKSFLSLWAFANLHTEEGFKDGRGSAKEFADALLIFGNDVVLFSDKHVMFHEDKPVDVGWARWYRKAIHKSAQQLYGALNWLRRFPNRIYLDAKCSRPLPISILDPSEARYHLVAVTRGSYDACAKWFPGSLGSHQIATDIHGVPQAKRPFTVGVGEVGKPFLHIFDEFSLEVVLKEFDTAIDFITYLRARETFLGDQNHLVMAAGEEQLVASYQLNSDGQNHWFTDRSAEAEKASLLSFDESIYPSLQQRSEYRAKQIVDKPSYVWDELIERFIRLGDPKIVDPEFVQNNAETEEGLRIIASESRFRRRMLVGSLREVMLKAAENSSGGWIARTVTAEGSNLVYIFLIFAKLEKDSYDSYRKYRVAVLHAYCKSAKLKFPEAGTFVGIAFDHPLKNYSGASEDLVIYRSESLSSEDRADIEAHRKELNIFSASLIPQNLHQDEFPQVLEKERANARPDSKVREASKERARSKKRKRDAVKASRRKNRKKK
jgi:hypothetical protein